MRFKYNDSELKNTLKKLVIVVDSREQQNSCITEWFDKKKIPYKVEKINMGDYGCMLPKGSFEGQERDIYFTDNIVIERKNGIDEVAGNLKDESTRLNTELAHLNKYGIKYFIFIEDPNFDKNIREGKFRSQYNPNALYARFKTIEARYNTVIRPTDKEFMGSEIYNTLYYHVREILKNKGFIEMEVEKNE